MFFAAITVVVIVSKPTEVVRDVPRDVVREVTKEVIKEVPAKIPAAYNAALSFHNYYQGSGTPMTRAERLEGVDSVAVSISLDDEAKAIVQEAEVRVKFEITLRRSGVKVDPKSNLRLDYNVQALKHTTTGATSYYESTTLWGYGWFRADWIRMEGYNATSDSIFWSRGILGFAGSAKVKEVLMTNVESSAEGFANDWLSANPKK